MKWLKQLFTPYTPKFQEGDRVMCFHKAYDADAGYEAPEGRVVAPGRYATVMLDLEFRAFPDEGMLEVHEDDLVLIARAQPEIGFLRKPQAG